MEWTEELMSQLRALWDAGRSTAEIGRMIGMSKNAVVGKAHRLNLPPRPSPIRREPWGQPIRPRPAARGPTLPPLVAMKMASGREAPPARPSPSPKLPPQRGAAAESGAPSPAAPLVVPGPPARGREMACCWPLGDPGTAGFHFCGGAAAPGKPYCAAHAQLAYVRVRDRREDAA